MLPYVFAAAMQNQVDPDRLPIGQAGEATISVGQVYDLNAQRKATVRDIVNAAKGKRFVYLGENHATLDHQRMEASVVDALVKAGRHVIVGMEMYQRPKQDSLDKWSTGALTSTEFEAQSDWKTQWGFPYYYYSPVFDVVKANHLPLIGLNVPRDWVRAVARGGFAALAGDAKAQLPAEMSLTNADHRQVWNALIGPHPIGAPSMDNMYAAQVLWDEGMADTALRYLSGKPVDPQQVFVVIAGSGHVLYKQGINYRVTKRNGGDGVTLVMEQANGSATVSRGIADFVYVSEADQDVEKTIPVGRGHVTLDDVKLEAYTYKPANYKNGPLIVIFHGTLRNADEYRTDAEDLARKWGALVLAPKFDAERFPGRKYNYGGILKSDNSAAPREEWTYALVPKIVDAVRKLEGRPDMPYYLLGHSAGGQFLVRMAGFMQNGAVRVIAANPGSELFPSADWPFGYGYGNLPAQLSGDDALKAYLAQPLSLMLGTADDHSDDYFDASPEAMRQGKSRYERGKNVFMFAQSLAKQKGWPFNWRLVEVKGVAHDHKKMFDSAAFGRALKP